MLEPDASLRCSKCSHRTLWPFQLEHHVQINHKNAKPVRLFHAAMELKLYFCTRCSFKTDYKLGLYEHCKHDCDCPTKKDTKPEIAGQSKRLTDSYPCNRCTFKGHSSLYFMKHLCQQIVTTAMKSIVQAATVRHRCCHCSYTSAFNANVKRHRLLRHAADEEITWYACAKCPYRAKDRGYLKKHNASRHAKADEISWYDCAECSYRAKDKRNLRHHVAATHADAITWTHCTQCSYRGKQARYLKRHMLTHARADDDIDWFVCGECFFQTKHKRSLERHNALVHASLASIKS